MKLAALILFAILSLPSFGKQQPKDLPTYLVYNQSEQRLITWQLVDQVRSIASVTKLMTALVVFENDNNLNQEIRYRGVFYGGRYVSKKKLLNSLLIRSDNKAADALAEDWPGGAKEFVTKMNHRARELGMYNTNFADPSGLHQQNTSTANDLIILINQASKNSEILKISSSQYFVTEQTTKKRVTQIEIPNTNKGLLSEFNNIVLSKTGWTTPAGRCLVLLVEHNKQQYAIVILGEKNNKDREAQARHLINNYVRAHYGDGL